MTKRLFLGLFLILGSSGVSQADTLAEEVRTVVNNTRGVMQGIDLDELEKDLTSTGVTGWIHGSAPQYRQFVFTYRDPKNFFRAVQLSVVARKPKLVNFLKGLNRHDEIWIRGEFRENESAQPHLKINEFKLVKKHKSAVVSLPFTHKTQLPQDLKGKKSAIFKVHAVVADGRILVVEYKDAVVPVFVENPSHTVNLYRNDKVRLHYEVLPHPRLPTHLKLASVANPVEILGHPMVDYHGNRAVTILEDNTTEDGVVGSLVLFPKSPQLKFNVFALQVIDSDGVRRNFTLVNFSDFDVFMGVLKKLQTAWDAADPKDIVNGRNKLVNPKIRIRAKGVYNVQDPNQANPQILLNRIDDIEILP